VHPWTVDILDALWRSAIGAVPLALLVALICRYLPHRPATRHALWCIVLLALLVLPLLPALSGDVATATPAPSASPDADAPDIYVPPQIGGPRIAPEQLVRDVDPQDFDAWAATQRAGLDEPSTPELPLVTEGESSVGVSAVSERTEPLAEEATQEGLARFDFLNVFANVLKATGIGPDDGVYPVEVASIEPIAANDSPDRIYPPAAVDRTDIEQASPTQTPPAATDALDYWRAWAGQLAAVRDAIGNVAPLPASLWIAGAALMFLMHVLSAGLLWRRLRTGWRAPADVRRVVAVAARGMGLRRAPRCLMVRGRVSPMIWCGWRRRLVLPVELWMELDDAGRRAVVTHELAHLRRRDHWMRWLDLALGCVYWWHPLVWWVRSRVQAEAEICCDAWVTWLMPADRRAYAGALLAAHAFVSSDVGAAPAVGIGAGTRNSRSFARRLTMIMTRKDAPGLSLTGWALAGGLILMGWAATPARSQEAPHVVVSREQPGATAVTLTAPEIVVTPSTPGTPGAVTTISAGVGKSKKSDDVEARLDRLETQMAEIAELLRSQASAGGSPGTPRAPHAWSSAPQPPAPPSPAAPEALFGVHRSGKYKQPYELPDGRREALFKLMARNDVPVVVSQNGNQIVVQGTAAQHAAFKRFVDLISDEEQRSYAVPQGKLEALVQLMIRNDVPVRVIPGEGRIEVLGTPAQQEIFENFLHLINGDSVAQKSLAPTDFFGAPSRKQAEAFAQYESAARLRDLARYKALAQTGAEAAERARVQAAALAEQRAAIEQEAQQLRQKADQMRKQAEQLRRQAEQMREQLERKAREEAEASERAGISKGELNMPVLQSKLDALIAQVDFSDNEADHLSELAAALSDQADAISDLDVEVAEEVEPAPVLIAR